MFVVENIPPLPFHDTYMWVYMYSYMGCAVGFLARNSRSWRTIKLTAVDVLSLGKGWRSCLVPRFWGGKGQLLVGLGQRIPCVLVILHTDSLKL